MWSLAVSAIALVLGSGNQKLTPEEMRAWEKIRSSVIFIQNPGRPSGVGAMIGERGYFIIHRASAPMGGGFAFGQLGTGEQLQLTYIGEDEVTQLALLYCEGYRSSMKRSAPLAQNAETANQSPSNALSLIAVLPSGPIRADLANSNRMGVMQPSQRGMTLNEIRFESPNASVNGALLYSHSGSLVGILGATLAQTNTGASLAPSAAGLGGGARTTADFGSFGPSRMTVGYTITPDILARVIEGFLSPSHKVRHPVIGVFCVDVKGGGIIVQTVTAKSNAEKSGIKVGDVIYEIDGKPINNTSDFSKFMIGQNPGNQITVSIRRGGVEQKVEVAVGS